MTSGLPPGVDLLGLASSFLLVIGLLAVLLFALKRMQGLSGGGRQDRQIEHLETMSAGARQKIVLLRVKDRELLVGISVGQIRTLAEWPCNEQVSLDSSSSGDSMDTLEVKQAESSPMSFRSAFTKAVSSSGFNVAGFLGKRPS
jgi:flagellar biosynthetic protein FliO